MKWFRYDSAGRGVDPQIAFHHQIADPLLWSLWCKSLIYVNGGQYDEALHSLREHLDLSGRLGNKFWRCRNLNTMGWVYMDLCHWDLAIQFNAQGVEESRTVGDPEIIRNAELNLADCYLTLERLDEAQHILESVYQECRRHGVWGEEWMKWRHTQHLYASLGELWLSRGDTGKALEFADCCLTAAEATESRRNIVKARRLKGEALTSLGRLEEAGNELEKALTVAREVGNPAQLRLTLTALGRLRQAQDRSGEARNNFLEAIRVVEKVASGLSNAELGAVLLASLQVGSLRGLVL